MKKVTSILFAVTLIGNAACSQSSNKIPADKVPAAVTAAFKAKFPAATKIG